MKKFAYIGLMLCLLVSCRPEDNIVPSEAVRVGKSLPSDSLKGFFLLNEGNMGSNKCTLDFYDFETGVYTHNIYAERNPGVVQELGDVGNDICLYGSRLYVAVNCSHFVEVMDARTARHLTQISVPNCRNFAAEGQYLYVTSYAGPIQIGPNSRLGYVARIDTSTLKVVDTCTVGYQPEQMAVYGRKLYVANSGGYGVPHYDNRVSVIDLDTFRKIRDIEVADNLRCVQIDRRRGLLYVSSQGDYYGEGSATYIIDAKTDELVESLPLLPCSSMTLCGDSLFVYSTEWNYHSHRNEVSYAVFNLEKRQVDTRNMIHDHTETEIGKPYGLAVNPINGDFYVTDAVDCVTPGWLHCYNAEGVRQWTVKTGDVPAHFAFSPYRLAPLSE